MKTPMISTRAARPHKVKNILKRVPGLRVTYRTIRAVIWRVQRHVFGPPLAEQYDTQTIQILERVLKPDSVCVDVGAHGGDILRHIVELAPNGRHHAVEAIPDFATKLATLFPSVQVHSCAVSDKTGVAEFLHVVNAPAYSGLREREYPYEATIREIRVPVSRLDDLIPKDERIALIKMDIEGGEYHAMLGAEKLLQRCRPVIIFEFGMGAADYYRVDPCMMFDLLTRCGLRVSTMQRWLDRRPELDRLEFDTTFKKRTGFYFMAYP